MDISEVSRNICRNVRFLRLKHKMSLTVLASLAGIGRASLRKLETGDIPARFRCNAICRICDIFGISADALFYDDFAQLERQSM